MAAWEAVSGAGCPPTFAATPLIQCAAFRHPRDQPVGPVTRGEGLRHKGKPAQGWVVRQEECGRFFAHGDTHLSEVQARGVLFDMGLGMTTKTVCP